MTSVDSNFNFLCGRPHGDGPPPPVHMRPPEPDPPPPPCGRHKWMVPYFSGGRSRLGPAINWVQRVLKFMLQSPDFSTHSLTLRVQPGFTGVEVGSATIRLRTFRLRHFVYRHFVYYCIPGYGRPGLYVTSFTFL